VVRRIASGFAVSTHGICPAAQLGMNKTISACLVALVAACEAGPGAEEDAAGERTDASTLGPQSSRDGATDRGGDAQTSRGPDGAAPAGADGPAVDTLAVHTSAVLTSGRDHACAITAGSIRCWGRGEHGQLGDGMFHDTEPHGVSSPVTVAVASPIQISAGQYHTCALLADRTVKCWGLATSGQLGDGSARARSAEPVSAAIAGVVQIAAGGDATCALLADGTVACWGFGTFGQLGNGASKSSLVPVPVSGLTNVTQISLGTSVGCALLKDRTVSCWGYGGDDAQRGTAIYHSTPVPIAVNGVVQIACGSAQACALLADGTVRCWGEGNVGQLGNGQWLDSIAPVAVASLANVVQLAPGRLHVCALLSDATVRCWGDGKNGQLGDGQRHDGFPSGVNTPVAVRLAGAVELGAGGAFSCARLAAGTFSCWGDNQYGQLADGTFTSTLQPVVSIVE
jgi:alpha-tubulin suppressor-like RCC1 family protein